jgi:hypothetical protein
MSAISCLESNQLTNLVQQKLTVLHLIKKFPTFYKTRRFITILTTAHHFSQSLATNSSPYPPIIRSGSSVGIVTGYGLDGLESRWGRDFSHTSRPALGPTQPPE